MTTKFLCVFLIALMTTGCGLGLNDERNPVIIRAIAPDKFAFSTKFDEDNTYQGYNLGISWNID